MQTNYKDETQTFCRVEIKKISNKLSDGEKLIKKLTVSYYIYQGSDTYNFSCLPMNKNGQLRNDLNQKDPQT